MCIICFREIENYSVNWFYFLKGISQKIFHFTKKNITNNFFVKLKIIVFLLSFVQILQTLDGKFLIFFEQCHQNVKKFRPVIWPVPRSDGRNGVGHRISYLKKQKQKAHIGTYILNINLTEMAPLKVTIFERERFEFTVYSQFFS